MNSFQRRKEARVKIELSVPVRKLCLGESKIINLNKTLPVKIFDLSANGALLFSVLELPLNLKFYMSLPINNEFIPCIVDIIRKEKKPEGFLYGCKLFVISENEKSKIRKFVFSKQVENIRINKNISI